jgi:predicted enzyme related to lactoylglutathione lyase
MMAAYQHSTEHHMGIRGNNHQIDNIEFNVADIARSKAFYGEAFGWTFTDYGPAYTEFSDGRLTGGFTTGEEVRPGGPLVILYADDLAEAQRRVEAAGGVISRAVFAFPGGRRFHFTDPDGYELAVWSADA